jgi:hypothetical protein
MLKNKLLAIPFLLGMLILASCDGNLGSQITVASSSQAFASSSETSSNNLDSSSASSASVASSVTASSTSSSSSALASSSTPNDGYFYAASIDSVIKKGTAQNIDVKGVIVSFGNDFMLISDGNKSISVSHPSQSAQQTAAGLHIRKAVSEESTSFVPGDYVEVRGDVTGNGYGFRTSLAFTDNCTVTKLDPANAPSIPAATDITSQAEFKKTVDALAKESDSGNWIATHAYKIPVSYLKKETEYNMLSFRVTNASSAINSGAFSYYSLGDFYSGSYYSLEVYFLSFPSTDSFNCAMSTFVKTNDMTFEEMTISQAQQADFGKFISTKGIVTGIDSYGTALVDDGKGRIAVEVGKEVIGGINAGDYVNIKGFVAYKDADTALRSIVASGIGLATADGSAYPTLSTETTSVSTESDIKALFNTYCTGQPFVKPSSYLALSGVYLINVTSTSAYARMTFNSKEYSITIVNPSGQGLHSKTTVDLKGFFYESDGGNLLFFICNAPFTDKRPTLVTIKEFQGLDDGAEVSIDAYVTGSGPEYFLIADATGWQYCEVISSLRSDPSLQNARRSVFTGTKRTDGGLEQFYVSAIKALGYSSSYSYPDLANAKQVTDPTSFSNLSYDTVKGRNNGTKQAVLLDYYEYPVVKLNGIMGYLSTCFAYEKAASDGPFGVITPDYDLDQAQKTVFETEYGQYDVYGFFIGFDNSKGLYSSYRFIYIDGKMTKSPLVSYDNILAGDRIPNPDPDNEPAVDPNSQLTWRLYATPIALDYGEKQLIRIHLWPIQIPVNAWNAYGLRYYFYESETATDKNIGTLLNFVYSEHPLVDPVWILYDENAGTEAYSCYVEFYFQVLGCVSNRITITYNPIQPSGS